MKVLDTVRNISAVKFVRDFTVTNAPAILTGVGIVGTVGTAVLTGQASFKAADLIRREQEKHQITLDKKGAVKLTWLMYLPAAGAGAGTVGAIFFANRINAKRLAAAFAAYSVAERGYTEYKEKVEKHFGKNKEQKVRDEIAQDHVTKYGDGSVIISTPGKVLCYDRYTARTFESTMEDLKSARNEINDTMLKTDYISLSDFYSQIGLHSTTTSDSMGWRADGGLVELDFSSTISDKGEPVLAFEFRPLPRPGYDLSH